MLDLKSKLAAAGLVTPEEVERAEKAKRAKGRKAPKGQRGGPSRSGRGEVRGLAVAKLRGAGKGEQYDAIRRFVEQVRLDDPGRPPTEAARPFHFPTAKGQVGRVTLEPEAFEQVRTGAAGIVAFMSNHGLAHAVVPAKAARSVAELFPLWLRVLEGHEGAGQLEPPPEPEPAGDG